MNINKSLINKLKHFSGSILTIIVFYFLFRHIDFALFFKAIKQMDFHYLIFAIIFYLTSFLVRGFRWKLLLTHIKPISLQELVKIMMAGYAINNVFPLRLGEFTRAYLVGNRNKISRTSSLASIFIERVFDGLSIVLILSITLFFYPFPEKIKFLAVITGTGFVFLFAVLLFSAFSSIPIRVITFLERKTSVKFQKIWELAKKFLAGAHSLKSPKIILKVLLLSFLVWSIELSVYYFTVDAFNINLPFVAFFLMLSAANLGMLAAPTPAGLGIFQAAIVSSMVLFSVVYEKAMAVSIVLHFVQIIPVTIIGILWLYFNHISIKTVKEEKLDV